VRWFGAVQSQDYGAAKWGVGMRTSAVTEAQLDRLFDEGAILRTHVLRPTWHFVLPEDFHWLAELTGPRVLAGLRGRHRQLEIDARTISHAESAFAKALAGGRHLTRTELGEVLRAARIAPDGQRLPHLILIAELHGLVTSGPRRGRQFTYALAEERARGRRRPGREEALAVLARRYFQSHGPAQLQDFVWWSGLTTADAKTAVGLIGDELEHEDVEDKEYWFDSDGARPGGVQVEPAAHLLPNFDEYTVAYRDRSALLEQGLDFDPAFFAFGSILANVIAVRGRVRGSWRRARLGRAAGVELKLLGSLATEETAAVERAVEQMAGFLEREVQLAWIDA
jgi:hypothetical protein